MQFSRVKSERIHDVAHQNTRIGESPFCIQRYKYNRVESELMRPCAYRGAKFESPISRIVNYRAEVPFLAAGHICPLTLNFGPV